MSHTSFSLFQIKAKLIYHVFLTVLHKFTKLFSDPVLSPKQRRVRLILVPLNAAISSENYTLFAKDVDAIVCQKTTLFYLFLCAGAYSQSCGDWRPGFKSSYELGLGLRTCFGVKLGLLHDYLFRAKCWKEKNKYLFRVSNPTAIPVWGRKF